MYMYLLVKKDEAGQKGWSRRLRVKFANKPTFLTKTAILYREGDGQRGRRRGGQRARAREMGNGRGRWATGRAKGEATGEGDGQGRWATGEGNG